MTEQKAKPAKPGAERNRRKGTGQLRDSTCKVLSAINFLSLKQECWTL